MRNLKSYADEVYKHKNNPNKLSELMADLAARYSYLAEEKKGLRTLRAEFWIKNKNDTQGKSKSDVKIETEWLVTEDGKKYDNLKIDMDAIEQMTKAITSILITSNREAKNEY